MNRNTSEPLFDLAVQWPKFPVVAAAATLGHGLYLANSTLGPSAGRGLFASQAFAKGQVITWYDGILIETHTAFWLRDNHLATHIHTLIRGKVFIEGNVQPTKGMGAGPYANDPRNATMVNAKFEACFPDLLVVKSTKNIVSGDEIFVTYDNAYWNMFKHLLDASDPPAVNGNIQPDLIGGKGRRAVGGVMPTIETWPDIVHGQWCRILQARGTVFIPYVHTPPPSLDDEEIPCDDEFQGWDECPDDVIGKWVHELLFPSVVIDENINKLKQLMHEVGVITYLRFLQVLDSFINTHTKVWGLKNVLLKKKKMGTKNAGQTDCIIITSTKSMQLVGCQGVKLVVFNHGRKKYPTLQLPKPLGRIDGANSYFHVRVHKLMCLYHNGWPTETPYCCHHICGNDECINHAHLTWITPTENTQDELRNRGARLGRWSGERNFKGRFIDGHHLCNVVNAPTNGWYNRDSVTRNPPSPTQSTIHIDSHRITRAVSKGKAMARPVHHETVPKAKSGRAAHPPLRINEPQPGQGVGASQTDSDSDEGETAQQQMQARLYDADRHAGGAGGSGTGRQQGRYHTGGSLKRMF